MSLRHCTVSAVVVVIIFDSVVVEFYNVFLSEIGIRKMKLGLWKPRTVVCQAHKKLNILTLARG